MARIVTAVSVALRIQLDRTIRLTYHWKTTTVTSPTPKDRLKQIARERYAGNQVILIIVQILLPILVQLILEWWQSRLSELKEETHDTDQPAE